MLVVACSGDDRGTGEASEESGSTDEAAADDRARGDGPGDDGGERDDVVGSLIEEIAETLRVRALFADRVDWASAVDRALDVSPRSDQATDAEPGIRLLLAELNDPHAGLVPAEAVATSEDQMSSTPDEVPSLIERSGDVVVMDVPPVAATPLTAGWRAYADAGLAVLVENQDACGFVIDLTRGGGTISPMLAAVGPLLGEGIHVRYLGRDGELRSGFGWSRGAIVSASADDPPLMTAAPADLDLSAVPVVLLVGPGTGSATEGVVVAFSGRQSTTLVGSPTAGIPTGTAAIDLPDGGRLVYAEAAATDRNGTTYTTAIEPDLPTRVTRPTLLSAALDSLAETAGCATTTIP